MAGKLQVGLDIDKLHRDPHVFACSPSMSALAMAKESLQYAGKNFCVDNLILENHQPSALIQSGCLCLLKSSLEHDFMRRLKEAGEARLIGAAILPAPAAFSPAQPRANESLAGSVRDRHMNPTCFNIMHLVTGC